MGNEIERKFLTLNRMYRDLTKGVLYKQGFLSSNSERVVRVRIAGNKGYLTVKGPHIGISRVEYEYEIPVNDADEMLEDLCIRPLIEKHRYTLSYEGFTWEIDEFHGENEGLVVAEIELEYESQKFKIPDWIGNEVTGDLRYYNSNLLVNPYCKWSNT
ncbi:MAG: CYTH domain-containing protein [Bacillota bacterium]|nr:CYTH domain-containing protein [Bacillota bacterium]